MPSTKERKTLFENIVVQYNNRQVRIHLYDTPLGKRFLAALQDNLTKQRILEKNFCFLGWADSKRNLSFLAFGFFFGAPRKSEPRSPNVPKSIVFYARKTRFSVPKLGFSSGKPRNENIVFR